jgi:hypothetical protein
MTKYTKSNSPVQARSSLSDQDESPEMEIQNLGDLHPQQFDAFIKAIVKHLFSNCEPPTDIWSRILGLIK